MKTLVETSLFNLFASYTNGAGPALGELPAAYDDFVNCLATLSPAGDLTGQLRCLNYTQIELAFMRQACNGMAEDCRNILYDVFIDKTLERMGFRSGNLLEPSMGIGAFFGALPDSMRKQCGEAEAKVPSH